jgi:hypothetical protein
MHLAQVGALRPVPLRVSLGKATQWSSLAPQDPQSRRLRAPADQRSAPHLNRSAAETLEESGPDKFG